MKRFGRAVGFEDRLVSYALRRGVAFTLASNTQPQKILEAIVLYKNRFAFTVDNDHQSTNSFVASGIPSGATLTLEYLNEDEWARIKKGMLELSQTVLRAADVVIATAVQGEMDLLKDIVFNQVIMDERRNLSRYACGTSVLLERSRDSHTNRRPKAASCHRSYDPS